MSNLKTGLTDLLNSLAHFRLWLMLGWLEIRQRYVRSRIGPFWMTISMGVMITSLGVVYGNLFGAELRDYLPALAVGFVFWGFISGTISEGCNSYVAAGAYLKQVPLNRAVFCLQTLWRNLIIFAHNAVIILIVLIYFGYDFYSEIYLFIPGFLLLLWNLLWISTLLATICARYRDLHQIVASILQVFFYITPILFKRNMLEQYPLLIELNPFAHFLEIVRSPLLGQPVPALSWIFSLSAAIIGTLICLWFHGRYRARIPYWV
ncbi:ABC transporter permease [Pseudochrobactrum sp. HB0163]|uniref:ABC transporter permease n=1 Tax=Pseudochrobactrum sp. HB0163 TaxID=3450708 RepID=UPI003F6E28FA